MGDFYVFFPIFSVKILKNQKRNFDEGLRFVCKGPGK
jgi:hypothetical protein